MGGEGGKTTTLDNLSHPTPHFPLFLQFKMAEVWGKRTLDAAKEKIESRGGVLPGSARGEGPGGVAMDEYEPLVSSNAEAAAVPSPGEEEVPIQL